MGIFITFEGIDGSGKSTQAKLLSDHLKEKGHCVRLTREPGGSVGAEHIRALLLEGEGDRWSPDSEILLFTAARRDHLERLILPALAANEIVICDRFADSTRVYQGLRGEHLRDLVDRLHELMIKREPDLTLLIDMDPKEGLARALGRQGGEERFESFGSDFQARLRDGFLDLAKEFPERFVVIDGARDTELVAEEIAGVVTSRLP